MNDVDQFWNNTFKDKIVDFEINLEKFDDHEIRRSLRNIRIFISGNCTNKSLLVSKTDIPNQLIKLCSKLIEGPADYLFVDEYLCTLNSLVNFPEFHERIVNAQFLRLLFHYITETDNYRKSSILLLRTILYASDINSVINSESKLLKLLKDSLTQAIVNQLIVIPCLSLEFTNSTPYNSISNSSSRLINTTDNSPLHAASNRLTSSSSSDSNILADPHYSSSPMSGLVCSAPGEISGSVVSLNDKHLGTLSLQLLSVLATNPHFNQMMFAEEDDGLLLILHKLLLQHQSKHITSLCHNTQYETKYILKILVFYIYYNNSSVKELYQIMQSSNGPPSSDITINEFDFSSKCHSLLTCYEGLMWIDDKHVTTLLGVMRGLILRQIYLATTSSDMSFVEMPSSGSMSIPDFCRRIEAVSNSGETIVSYGLGITNDMVYKYIINPLTLSDAYLELNGLGCWVLHTIFLVVFQQQQHNQQNTSPFSLSGILLQCNGFFSTIDERLTPRLQSSLDIKQNNKDGIDLKQLVPLFKLLAWLSAQNDNVKIMIGDTDFFLVVLERYHQNCQDLFKASSITNSNTYFNLGDIDTKEGYQETVLQKSVWLLIHSLSRSATLHGTVFPKISKYTEFIKHLIDYYIDLASDNQCEHLKSNQHILLIRDLIHCCLSSVANLILPTSPLRNDLMEWAVDKFIQVSWSNGVTHGQSAMSHGTSATSVAQSSSIFTNELKLVGLCGLVNCAYSIVTVNLQHYTSSTNAVTGAQTSGSGVSSSRYLILDNTYTSMAEDDYNDDNSRITATIVAGGGSGSAEDNESSASPQPYASFMTDDDNNPQFLHADTHFDVLQQQSNAHQHQQKSPKFNECFSKIWRHLILSIPSIFQVLNLNKPSPLNQSTVPDVHNKILLVIWVIFRNVLHYPQTKDELINQHGTEIVNFIISTFESNCSSNVKEQAMIVLAHLATNSSSREQLALNEDLMEKLKLYSKSTNNQLQTAANYATMYIVSRQDADNEEFQSLEYWMKLLQENI